MPTYLPIGVIGAGKRGIRRANCLRAIPNVLFKGIYDTDATLCHETASLLETIPFDKLSDLLKQVQILVIANPTSEHFEIAQMAIQQGIHVFLDGKPTASIHESELLLKMAEETNVEIGVSAPLRFHPALTHLPDIPKLLTIEADVMLDSGRSWQYELSHLLHLCLAITHSEAIQRLEATAVHTKQHQLQALALGMRFQNGVYVQIRLRQRNQVASKLFAAAPHFQFESDLRRYELCLSDGEKQHLPKTSLHFAEMQAFTQAVRAQNAAPVSLLQGISVQRIAERVMQRLR